jgi:predicted O-methyltransferase YrrM
MIAQGITTVLEDIKNVDGWLAKGEAILLYQLASKCAIGQVIVEIGSYKGKSTICLGKGSNSRNSTRIYAIDPHVGSPEHKAKQGEVWTYDEFLQNIQKANLGDLVLPILKFSKEAVEDINEPIGLLFIDGAHEYEAVKQDFSLWNNKIAIGGTIAFHDSIWWEGVRKVVTKNIFFSREYANIFFVESIICATRVSSRSCLQMIRSKYIYYLFRLYYWLRVKKNVYRLIPYRGKIIIEKLFSLLQWHY